MNRFDAVCGFQYPAAEQIEARSGLVPDIDPAHRIADDGDRMKSILLTTQPRSHMLLFLCVRLRFQPCVFRRGSIPRTTLLELRIYNPARLCNILLVIEGAFQG